MIHQNDEFYGDNRTAEQKYRDNYDAAIRGRHLITYDADYDDHEDRPMCIALKIIDGEEYFCGKDRHSPELYHYWVNSETHEALP